VITIIEAIFQLSGAGETGAFTYDQTFKDACKLGKEALLQELQHRETIDSYQYHRLPSETEE
jgi:hypothetical protein